MNNIRPSVVKQWKYLWLVYKNLETQPQLKVGMSTRTQPVSHKVKIWIKFYKFRKRKNIDPS